MMKTDDFVFTDFEQHIQFDLDDPDFEPQGETFNNQKFTPFYTKVTSPDMSLSSLSTMHPGCRLNHRSQSYSSISSLDEPNFYNTEAVLSIEELRLHYNSCFTCGVSWYEDHVSLDCRECGGYSLERPCPMCDGRCQSLWKRDLTMSHASAKAKWSGQCGFRSSNQSENTSSENNLCSRVEKLTSSS